jgi:hypothetical protein
MALTIDRHQLEISNRGNAVISNARPEPGKNRVVNPAGAHNQ